jgi:beta-mannosidase  (EC 3.2.1.25)
MRHGMEAHRRNRPYCMGTLYWQLNDSWPVVSWSSVDYFGNWKALHYQAQRAFSPLLVNAIEEKGKLNFYLISDELNDRNNLTLESRMVDFSGKVLKKEVRKVNMKANSSTCVWEQDSASAATAQQRTDALLLLTLKDSKGKVLDKQTFYFEKAQGS